jgi:hypothetical protein
MRSSDVPVRHNAEARLHAARASAQVNMGDQLVVGAHGVIPKCRFRSVRLGRARIFFAGPAKSNVR